MSPEHPLVIGIVPRNAAFRPAAPELRAGLLFPVADVNVLCIVELLQAAAVAVCLLPVLSQIHRSWLMPPFFLFLK